MEASSTTGLYLHQDSSESPGTSCKGKKCPKLVGLVSNEDMIGGNECKMLYEKILIQQGAQDERMKIYQPAYKCPFSSTKASLLPFAGSHLSGGSCVP